MPLRQYGVVKGTVVSLAYDRDDRPHLHVLARAGREHFDVSINVKSIGARGDENQALFLIDEHFRHPVTEGWRELAWGFTRLGYERRHQALDYIRGNLFEVDQLEPVPPVDEGDDNDLFAKLSFHLRRAAENDALVLYAFGEPWYAERRNYRFDFKPDRGIHEIHMNQGNDRTHRGDNGIWQDGGLFLHDTRKDWWTAVFVAFEAQSWHTDDRTGHTIPERARQRAGRDRTDDGQVKIIALTPHPPDGDAEEVFLLNTTPDHLIVDGWSLMDGEKNREPLHGFIAGNSIRRIKLTGKGAHLPDSGGMLTLLDNDGHKVHGVAYTADSAVDVGRTLALGAHGTRLS